MSGFGPRLWARFAVLVFGLLTAGAASAETSTCDPANEPPTGACLALSRAAVAPSDHPHVARTAAVWQRVNGPFAALTGRETQFRVLAESARVHDRPIPPAAYVCPAGPPVVYVPWTLVDLVYEQKRYPEDFLAFVLGHELGHRVNDLSPRGCTRPAEERPGQGEHEEQLADARGAFFAAVGGFSTRTVAQGDLVSRFLDAEYGLRGEVAQTRREALAGALEHFDAYEDLYETATGLAFSGDVQAAVRLATWADELVTGHGVPLPELRVLRALLVLVEVGPSAPAWAPARYRKDVRSLRCIPPYPGHTSLWEEPARRVRSDPVDAEQALREAQRWLREAEALGANTLVTASALACTATYLGEIDAARSELQRARAAATKKTPRAVVDQLSAIEALTRFVDFLAAHPLPDEGSRSDERKWSRALQKATRSFAAHDGVSDVARRYRAYPKLADRPARARRCKGARARPPAMSRPPSWTEEVCPSGWTEAHVLQAAAPTLETESDPASQPVATVRTCVRAEAPQERLVTIRLPGSLRPAFDPVNLVLVSGPPPPQAATVAPWACGCRQFTARGVSDRGSTAYSARCGGRSLPNGAVFVAPDGRVERVVGVYVR